MQGDLICILPPGYRPSSRLITAAIQNEGNMVRLDIYPDGAVRVDNGIDGSNIISLGSISFAKELQIGDNYAGGIVFYLADPLVDLNGDGVVDQGLIAAPTDQSIGTKWGCFATAITGTDSTAIGTGNQNTIDIVVGCETAGIAARLCNDLVLSGFDDWFLPSKDELDLMWENLADSDGNGTNSGPADLGNLGGFVAVFYWSSSEMGDPWAWACDFSGGVLNPRDRDHDDRIRASRAF